MKISFVTMCPEMFDSFDKTPNVKHALDKGILEIEIVDIKNYSEGSFRHIDDSPYGGGAGMIIRYDVLHKCLSDIKRDNSFVLFLTPVGYKLEQSHLVEYSKFEHLIVLCGHYEGVDYRIIDEVDACMSVGDFIVSGGEIPAMLVVDGIVRLLEGVIKNESVEDESFSNGLLEYPQYTRPIEYNNKRVPEVLVSGNHELIKQYRNEESIRLTKKYRKDLWDKYEK